MRNELKRMLGVLCWALLLLPALVSAAGVDTMWLRHYEGTDTLYRSENQSADVLVDTLRNHVLICGSGQDTTRGPQYTGQSDMMLVMYDRTSGRRLDVDVIGGWAGSGTDMGHSMAMDANGNVYVTGFTSNGDTRGDDITWMKYGTTGDSLHLVWIKKSVWNGDDQSFDIAIGKQNDVYICGTKDTTWGAAYLVMRISPDSGAVMWRRAFYMDTLAFAAPKRDIHPAFLEWDWSDYENCAVAMAVGPDSNIVVTGFGTEEANSYCYEWWTMKFRPNGDTVWTRVDHNPYAPIPDDDDVAFDVAVSDSGDIYVCGFGYRSYALSYNFDVARYLSNGQRQTWQSYGADGDDAAFSICLDDSVRQNVYVTGYIEGALSSMMVTAKFSNTLVLRWGTTGAIYDGNGDDYGYDIAHKRGKVYVAGRRGGVAPLSDDMLALCYTTANPAGGNPKDTLWTWAYNSPDSLEDYAAAIVVADSDNIYVAGQSARRPRPTNPWISQVTARLFQPRPDVQVARIVAPVDTVNQGDSIRPKVWVKNSGNTLATFKTYLNIGSTYRDSFLNVALAPRDSALDSFPKWYAGTFGPSVVRCTVALPRDTVPSNNRVIDTVYVARRDVACSLLVAPVGAVDSGVSVTPQAWLVNRGNMAETFRCRFVVGSWYADTQIVVLGPGASILQGFDPALPLQRGRWAVLCSTMLALDPVDTNNARRDSVTVRVTDAALAAIIAPPESVGQGDTLQPQARFRNNGSAAATLRCFFIMEHGTDTVGYLDSTAVTLAPLAETLVTFARGAPVMRLGTWRIAGWCALANDQHPENDSVKRSLYVGPPGGISWPPGWIETTSLPLGASGKAVKAGGSLAAMQGGTTPLVYATKGYKTDEFYCHNFQTSDWGTLRPVPLGTEAKPPYTGAGLCTDNNGSVYLIKGNNTLGFYRYSVADSTWTQLDDVPLGSTGKKVKGGADLAFVEKNDSGFVYLLKGYKNEFHRYNILKDTWQTMPAAPTGVNMKWDKGSFIVYDGAQTIYAHKAKYHELWKYDLARDSWVAPQLTGMPMYNSQGRRKKAKDGSSAAWFEGGFYAFKGGNTQEFWHYNPDADSWREMDTIPAMGSTGRKKRVKDGGDIVYNAYAVWAFKGNKTREFWRYGIPFGVAASSVLPERSGVLSPGVKREVSGSWGVMPNPLSGSGLISYSVPGRAALTARIYDAAGRLVAVPIRDRQVAGNGTIHFETGSLAAGVYLLRLDTGSLAPVRSFKLVVE